MGIRRTSGPGRPGPPARVSLPVDVEVIPEPLDLQLDLRRLPRPGGGGRAASPENGSAASEYCGGDLLTSLARAGTPCATVRPVNPHAVGHVRDAVGVEVSEVVARPRRGDEEGGLEDLLFITTSSKFGLMKGAFDELEVGQVSVGELREVDAVEGDFRRTCRDPLQRVGFGAAAELRDPGVVERTDVLPGDQLGSRRSRGWSRNCRWGLATRSWRRHHYWSGPSLPC